MKFEIQFNQQWIWKLNVTISLKVGQQMCAQQIFHFKWVWIELVWTAQFQWILIKKFEGISMEILRMAFED